MNSSKKVKRGQIEDFISDSAQSELNKRTLTTAIVDALTSTNGAVPLSANQGRILKGHIDNLITIVSSDDTTLDEIQELVDYIKQNRSDLQNLSISNIAGLVNALAGKEDKSNKGAANGYAPLVNSKVPDQYLPSPGNPDYGSALASGSIYLDNIFGRNYIVTPASFLSYEVSSDAGFERTPGGWFRILINTASEPTVYLEDGITEAVKISGSPFVANTNMELIVEATGAGVEYFFLKR